MLITRKWAMPNGQTFVIEEMERPAGDPSCAGAADTSEEDIDKALAQPVLTNASSRMKLELWDAKCGKGE